MDYFEENIEVEDLEKKTFEENYKKQAKLSKRIFKIMGSIFIALAIVLLIVALIVEELEFAIPSIPLGFIGLVFIVLGLVFPNTLNYENLKKRQSKYGQLNIYELNAKVIVLEEKNKALEARIKELENEVRKLR